MQFSGEGRQCVSLNAWSKEVAGTSLVLCLTNRFTNLLVFSPSAALLFLAW